MGSMNISIIGLGKLGKSLYDVIRDHTHHYVSYNDLVIKEEYNYWTIKDISILSDLIFICVDTPEDDRLSGSQFYNINEIEEFDYDYNNIVSVLNGLENTKSIVVITSTVSPNHIDYLVNSFSHLTIIYNPFMFEGGNEYNSIKEQENVIIGCKTDPTPLIRLYEEFNKKTRYHITDFKSASLIKMTHNLYVSLRIGFVNSIQRVSDFLDVNPKDVLDPLKSFPVFNNPKFLNIGLPSGGPCIPRDSLVVSKIIPDNQFLSSILEERMNHTLWLTNKIKGLMKSQNKQSVTLIGVSYKKGITSTKGSPALLLKESLERDGIDCYVDNESERSLNVLINSTVELKYPYYDVWEDKFIYNGNK